MKRLLFIILMINTCNVFANVIPVGRDNNSLYYKIGGGSDYALPPVSNTETVNLDTDTNLSMGYSCTAFNPALSLTNSLNDLKDSAENLSNDLITNATGSIIMMPMYELAKRNPTLYALFNNHLLNSEQTLSISSKSCQSVKDEISRGQNPYQDWATVAVNDQWKKNLSLTATGDEDINQVKKDLDAHGGDDGVNWVSGTKDNDGSYHAGGSGSQPPVHVIADTVKAGYNTILNRDLQSNDPAPSSELANVFPTPQAAVNWLTSVIGDQIITTCNDDACKQKQGSVVGHGLLPWLTSCENNNDNCVDTIQKNLANLVSNNEAITKDNLDKVSAEGIAMSPDAINAISRMDTNQKNIIINKLAQEIAMQRIIDKSLTARNVLSTGAQVPVIAANQPAQAVIDRGLASLDNDIRSLTFERQIRKQMMTDTLSEVLNYTNTQQQNVMQMSPISPTQPLMTNSAITTKENT